MFSTRYSDFRGLPKITVLIKYYVIKHLTLIKRQNLIDIKDNLLQRFVKSKVYKY